MDQNTKQKQCPEFPFFGATYPDATCIDGTLYDLDDDNGDGTLNNTHDVPCPFCNKEAFMQYEVGDKEDYESEDEYNEARIRVDGWLQSIEQRYS